MRRKRILNNRANRELSRSIVKFSAGKMPSLRRTLWASTPAKLLALALALQGKYHTCRSLTAPRAQLRKFASCRDSLVRSMLSTDPPGEDEFITKHEDNTKYQNPINPGFISRRQALVGSATMAAAMIPLSAFATLDSQTYTKSLEDVQLGQGSWTNIGRSMSTAVDSSLMVPAFFATYIVRFLIQYDEGVASWWMDLNKKYSLLSDQERGGNLGRSFGYFAASIQSGIDSFLQGSDGEYQDKRSTSSQDFSKLARLFLEKYGTDSEAKRQIGILFSMLPPKQQPLDILNQLSTNTIRSGTNEMVQLDSIPDDIKLVKNPPPRVLTEDLGSLLPPGYECVRLKDASSYTVYPALSLYEVSVEEEFGKTVVATPFGPLATNALTRELPNYSIDIYTLLGISGATGCALTHSVVIPLDVVKTKAQTNPDEFKNLFEGAMKVVDQEGIQGLLNGAQATIAGFFWYGLSVYPSYTFFKRYITQGVLAPEIAAIHSNDIALIAGAIAAVIASLGLTPLEAARIRAVAEPEKYRPLGLTGTLQFIADEDPQMGWKSVYAGLPSLLTRQVIFGSVKFLAFERACEAIFAVWPTLRDATWTALAVSLVAGGCSGALSSVVSQPADSVLTYVAQNSGEKGSLGVIDGCVLMVKEEGIGSLFRGLGSRCVWAGSIIAGQFLLYDVFRNYFYVNGQDLSQVFQIVISGQST